MQSTFTPLTHGHETAEHRSDTAAKWKPIWAFSYIAGLALSALLAVRGNERPHATPLFVVVGMTFVASLWHFVAAVRRPEAHRITKPMLLWAVVAIGVNAMLVWMAPVYLFAASFLFACIFQLMPWRSAAPTAMLLSAALWKPVAASLGNGIANMIVCAAIGACLFSAFVTAVIEQNRERRRTIVELRRAEAALATMERHAGRLEERARIARELHDTVTQNLVGITMQLDAQVTVAKTPTLERLRNLSRGALADARNLVNANRPRELDQHGSLAAALEALAERGDTLTPMLTVHVDDDAILNPEQQNALFRIAQEALSNARRHARATQITMTVSVVGSRVMLDVCDDGIGFDSLRARKGFGLESIAARAKAVHGTFAVESAPGEGTTIHVQIPIWR